MKTIFAYALGIMFSLSIFASSNIATAATVKAPYAVNGDGGKGGDKKCCKDKNKDKKECSKEEKSKCGSTEGKKSCCQHKEEAKK